MRVPYIKILPKKSSSSLSLSSSSSLWLSLSLSLSFLLAPTPALARGINYSIDERPYSAARPVAYQFGIAMGYTLRDDKVDPYLNRNLSDGPVTPPVNIRFAMEWAPEWQSLRDWNRSQIGLAIDWQHLGNQEWLGNAFGAYTYLNIPLVKTPHFRLGLRPGVGLALIDKTYWNTRPADDPLPSLPRPNDRPWVNQCVGSHLNAYLNEALYFECPIEKGWSLGMSVTWQHYSNGSTRQPNSGYNILGGELFARHQVEYIAYDTFLDDKNGVIARPKDMRNGFKKWDVEFGVSGGARQVYYRDKRTFGVGSVSLAAHYRPWAVFKIGLGVDAFYDGAYQRRLTSFAKTATHLAKTSDCFRLGVSLQPEFVVGKFSAGFHVGAYLLDGVKNLEYTNRAEQETLGIVHGATSYGRGHRLNRPMFYSYDMLNAGSAGKPDGWLYTRIVLRYRVHDHIFLQTGLKAHLTKAEFVDVGLGFCY